MFSACGLIILIGCFAIPLIDVENCLAQEPTGALHNLLPEKTAFSESDSAALDQGQPVIKILPSRDPREIAMYGVLRLQAPADVFLKSFRENMTQKSNAAILEIGSFSNAPSIDDLQALTIDDRDLDDLRQCVVGDCRLKLSAQMIERLQKEINWEAPNYRIQVSQLLKQMLVDYVRDYLARGEAALIEYADKANPVRLADEQAALLADSSYGSLTASNKNQVFPGGSLIANTVVWSKIKFGLKPVIAINHIRIYQRASTTGAEIVSVSEQIYANHYFDSSLGLTAFLNVPDPTPKSYLLYENRSRLDGLEGAFGKIKRGIIEGRAVGSLESILQNSQATLNARALNSVGSSLSTAEVGTSLSRLKISRAYKLLLLLCFAVCAALLGLRIYPRRKSLSNPARLDANPALITAKGRFSDGKA